MFPHSLAIMHPNPQIEIDMDHISRRNLLIGGAAVAIGATGLQASRSNNSPDNSGPPELLMQRARAAFDRHRAQFTHDDRIGVVDYAAHSGNARFFIINRATGRSRPFLVSHGRGSDPSHSGYVQRFSNRPGSLASSAGTYLTARRYEGTHGASRRLQGLDPQNSNAEARAIVIHPAWYVGEDIVRQQGRVGRSEGCFAFAPTEIETILDQLGAGRMIYVDKV